MSSDSALIAWKTNAWQDRNMVAGYAARMRDPAGTILLKNRIEVGAIAKYVKGSQLLDVGVGTGRASLPLARAGYNVTGVDASTAMLDKVRELAAGVPIELLPRDLSDLRFPDHSFDSVLSLNTISHFPHWQPILKEWQRVTKPHGRLILDLFSLDHDIAYARATGRDEAYAVEALGPKDASGYYLRLKIDDVIAYADERGLRIAALQPYSVLFGSAGINRFLDRTPAAGNAWDRLLSWVGADERLFDFLTFLEEDVFGKLTTNVAFRFFAVFDNVADRAANAQWRTRNDALNRSLQAGLTADTLACAQIDPAYLRRKLNTFLAHAPSRYTLYKLLTAGLGWNWSVADDLLDEPYRSEAAAVVQRARLDADCTRVLTEFHRAPELQDALDYHGVPLAASWEYDAMISALTNTFGAFETPLTSLPARPAGS